MDCWPPWAPPPPLGLASHPMGNVSWMQRLIQRLSDSYKHSCSGAEGFVSGHLNRSSSTQTCCCQNHSCTITCVPHICRLALNLNRTFLFHVVFCVYTMRLTSLSWLSMESGERSLYIKILRTWRRGIVVRCPGGAKSSDRLWCPRSLLFDGYRGLFGWDEGGRGVQLTTEHNLAPR